MTVTWEVGLWNCYHAHLFDTAIEESGMHAELRRVWDRYLPLCKRKYRKAEYHSGGAGGGFYRVPHQAGNEVWGIVHRHITHALKIVAARLQEETAT